jgi:hypothetical protein
MKDCPFGPRRLGASEPGATGTLDPTEDGGWIDLDTAFEHHFSQITVADVVFAVPADAQKNDLNRKAAAIEDRYRSSGSLMDRSSYRQ